MEIELPFKAEYAKSGRAGCKGCKMNIAQGSLRIAAMVQSAFHDGKQANWYHDTCFLKKQRPTSVGDIENYQNLRMEDQKKLEKAIQEISSVVPSSNTGKRGKKRQEDNLALKDFGIEYSKTSRATCRGCEQKIIKGQIRIRKTVYDTEVGMKYGGQMLWHHTDCFAKLRTELKWLDTAENIPGFNTLSDEDKTEMKKLIPAIKSSDGPAAKKIKTEKLDVEEKKAEKDLMKKLEKQMERLYWFRDRIKEHMSKVDQQELLKHNSQEPIQGDSEKLLDQLADMLCFGVIQACPECSGKKFLFHKSGYLCQSELTDWTKCTTVLRDPKRTSCVIPSEMKENYKFLKNVKNEPQMRIIRYIEPSVKTTVKHVSMKKNEEDNVDGPKVKRERPPLYQMKFAYINFKGSEDDIKKRIMQLGGECSSRITEKTVAVFATAKDVEKLGSRMLKAREMGLHILPIDYIDAVEKNPNNAITYITSMTLCDWGTDPAGRIPQDDGKSSLSKSIYTKSVPKSVTLKVKDGLAVDPDSGLQDETHVYVSNNKDKYNVVLGCTDVQRNKNSYYKLQLLESDNKKKYYVFRSWGRIGTTIGSTKLEKFKTLMEAMDSFKAVYLDKTGNAFEERQYFVKIPGCMYPIDIDYGVDHDKMDLKAESSVASVLPKAVQEIVNLIFDVENMKRTMLEFHLDMEKMPLGKLSQKQIQSAYKVLTEIYTLINKKASNVKFIDATNRFYTLIPHNFGTQSPPLLDTMDQIENLRQMLDNLLEIECAYNLIQIEDKTANDKHPLDLHYEQLKATLEPLDKTSDEFLLLQTYVQNTHAETHNLYELEIVDIFKVARQGEARRYKPFKKLHNRRLLWHGSRLTNFAGILSHGLKIAPPEAPVTGYMFGKGIYFADMVSKSANYCGTSAENSTGLILLSEVALGDMMECTAAKYISKLPKQKDSCFGRGRTMPDPKESHFTEDNVEIPLGKPITDDNLKTSLLYNEFIVYDTAQVNIRYLLRLNFKYKY